MTIKFETTIKTNTKSQIVAHWTGRIFRLLCFYSFNNALMIFGIATGCSSQAPLTADKETIPEVVEPTENSVAGEADFNDAVDLVPIGRALEAGDVEKAAQLIAISNRTSPEAILLSARIASRQGKHNEAIVFYVQLKDKIEGFEGARSTELAIEMAKAGRFEEAASKVGDILAHQMPTRVQQVILLEKRAQWFLKTDKPEAAIIDLETAFSKAKHAPAQERIKLAIGRTLLELGDKERAKQLLKPLTIKSRKTATMTKARKILQSVGITVKWSPSERLDRARTLIKNRSWKPAVLTLEPISSGNLAVAKEARWLMAQVMFKRRGHYTEAIELLTPISKGKGAHADDARLMIARALSRQDRDYEAIKAYRSYAAKTRNKNLAVEARFLAARLEYYLGMHKKALRSLENLVGKGGKKTSKLTLGPSRRRDAHFLAGLCAILENRPLRALPHLISASSGTNNSDVLARNAYWAAVARTEAKMKDGPDSLRAICQKDSTSWYARLAAVRLSDKNLELGQCVSPVVELLASDTNTKAISLEELSSAAAFLARAGLFREAAAELRQVEKDGKIKATANDWVQNYVALDAPHFAIRRASIGLEWPPGEDDLWRLSAAYPTPYVNLVEEVEVKHNLPDDLIYAIARKESLFDPNAVSGVGAMGMMQMMPKTYETNRKRAGLPELETGALPGPFASIRAAGFELSHLLKQFDGSLPLAIMAYNGGCAAVQRWLDRSGDLPLDIFVEKAGFGQTRNYVKRVYKSLNRYRLLKGKEMPQLPKIIKRINSQPK